MSEAQEFNEKGLIRGAKRGSNRDFGKLYDQFLPQIYRFTYLKVMNRQDAEDICHQVFLSAWTNIKNYKDIGYSFSTWLYRIARNAVIDFYRTKKTHVELASIEDFLPDSTDLAAQTGATLATEKVLAAFPRLTDEQRDVIIMSYIEELDHGEIAEVMEKSEGAVRVLKHRALESLKKILAEDAGTGGGGSRIHEV